MTRCTSAVAGVLALVSALSATAPTPSPTTADRGDDATIRVESVQVPVTPDDGGHWVDARGEEHTREFTTFGTKWDRNALTYGFVNHTPDVSVSAQEAAIARALRSWASVTPLSFTQVPDCNKPFNSADCDTPDIRIFFGTGDHGDGPNLPDFDGPGGTAAHGFYPPPNGLSAAGDLHLDEAERWSTNGTGVDLESVALHELGHSLGLTHASSSQCPSRASSSRPIMCATIIGTDRSIAQDDINGIRSLYGRPANACAGYKVTVDLGDGDRPTSGPDVIAGTPGDDVINAGAGNDIVCGGGGNDRIELGAGSDKAYGGPGNDTIYGRDGGDRIDGGSGNDRAYGGNHNDQLYGGDGADVLNGGSAADKLYGGPRGDNCDGSTGRDASSGCERRSRIESLIR